MDQAASSCNAFAIATFSSIVLLFYRNKQYERELQTMRWKISFEDIVLSDRAQSTSNKVRKMHVCIDQI